MGARGPFPSLDPRRRNSRPTRGVVTIVRPAMPRELTGEARAEWRRVLTLLEEIGALHTVDRSLLIRYCRGWAEWCELDALLLKTGRLVKGQKGNLVRNPLWLLRRDTGQALNDLAAQLGISPSARLRSGVRHQRPEPRLLAEQQQLTDFEAERRRRLLEAD